MELKEKEMKIPKIGSTVYILCIDPRKPWKTEIFKAIVGYLGKGSFIIKGYRNKNLNDVEQFYEYYNIDWFTDIKKAKKEMLKYHRNNYGGRWKVVTLYDFCWGVAEY